VSWPVGHEALVEAFRGVVAGERLAHAYLFAGPVGVGKRAFARTLGKLLLCEGQAKDFQPCGRCPACLQVDAETHPDFHVARAPEDAHEFPVELMKEFIGQLALKPARGRYRIAILEDADMLNDESANAFLKTLEEPPPRSLLILVATSVEHQLPTIRSRCQLVRFPPLPAKVLAEALLAEGLVKSREQALRLAEQCEGSLESARQLADAKLQEFRRKLLDALAAPRPDSARLGMELVKCVEEAGKESAGQRQRAQLLIRFVTEFLRSCLLLGEGAAVRWADPADERSARQLTQRADADTLLQAIERCLEAEAHVERRVQLVLALEALVDAVTATLSSRPAPA
jgi:DNA polymerase-3 subunit delta'